MKADHLSRCGVLKYDQELLYSQGEGADACFERRKDSLDLLGFWSYVDVRHANSSFFRLTDVGAVEY